MRRIGFALVLAGCGGGGGEPDARNFVCDAAPVARLCGCDGIEPCFSFEVSSWVTGEVIGPADGVTAYLVAVGEYDDSPLALAEAVPDADGYVVFDPPGEPFFVMLGDGALWTYTSVGPFDPAAPEMCVRLPAIRRDVGDGFLEDAAITDDAVLLELRGACGQLAAGVALTTEPEQPVSYFVADRTAFGDAPETTSASAVLTRPATYCSPTCENEGCTTVERGGVPGGILVAQMRCDAP